MYTECPSCKTFFKITPNQLKAAGGRVRCGNCDEIFNGLDGLVDVVPDEAVAEAAAQTESESKSDTISSVEEKSVEPEITEPVSSLEKSELAAEKDTPQSLDDVEIPTTNEIDADDDAESTLKSAVVEEPKENKPVTRQDAINNDIDAALDGLFDTEMPSSSGDETASKIEAVSELSAISELDELQDLSFKNPAAGDKADSEKSKEASSLGIFSRVPDEAPRSEALKSEADLDSDMSSLSEFERELGAVSAAPLAAPAKGEPLVESSFDLGDSFLDSDIDAAESAVGKKSNTKKEEREESGRAGDSYLLEEIEGKKKRKSSVVAKVLWITIILALLFVLLGQFAYMKRQDLAAYPEAKPIIEKLCAQLNAFYPCEITPAKDVSKIELLERNVVSHPNAENALLITSTIENKAEFDQAFPDLILTFSDINQKIIAKRTFSPAEYLSKEVDIDAGMKKRVPVKIMLEIVDPGEEAVNFEFNFQ